MTRRQVEREMQADLLRYFAGLRRRIVKEVGKNG